MSNHLEEEAMSDPNNEENYDEAV
jgi:hypothetical protein